jgi:hypothetical protein
MPVTDNSVALYLQSVMNNAKTYGSVIAAFAAIAFYQKINLSANEPTQSPAVCIVRSVAMRKFGLNAKNRKEPLSGTTSLASRWPMGYGIKVIVTWWWQQ